MSITKFTEYFEGYFDNQRQAFHAPREFALIEVNHTKIDETHFRISQKYIIDKDPYRVAIVEVSETEDGKILLKSYEDTEERLYKEGCDVLFEYDADIDRFYGTNVCKECYVEKNGNNTYLKTEAYLGPDYYQVSDTGHDPDTDEQVWGSYHGLFNFDKK
jgi:hypothetical protein